MTTPQDLDRDFAEAGYAPVLCKARVAKLLECSIRTVERYQAEGLLEALGTSGRHPRYRRREVARFLVDRDK